MNDCELCTCGITRARTRPSLQTLCSVLAVSRLALSFSSYSSRHILTRFFDMQTNGEIKNDAVKVPVYPKYTEREEG